MREFVTYDYISHITHIQVGWLKKHLPMEMESEQIKGNQVDLQAFKGWMRNAKLVPLSRYFRYMGFSEGCRSSVTNKKRERHEKIAHWLVPTTRESCKYYCRKEHAKELLEAARESKRGRAKLGPKKYLAPDCIYWPKDGKPVRIPRLKKKEAFAKPKDDGQTEMRYEADTPPVPPPSSTPPEPPTDPKPDPSPSVPPDSPKTDETLEHPQVTVDIAHDLGEKMAKYGRPSSITFKMPFGVELTFSWKN